jgi:hypothetical protein
MVVEKYKYLVLELEARTDEQKRDFLKSLMDNERRQKAIKDVLKIICRFRDFSKEKEDKGKRLFVTTFLDNLIMDLKELKEIK